jgi:two-component system, NtrC family, nitrogen regulation sensor histidine kinase NtrY
VNLRQKMLAMIAVTVMVTVAAVGWTVSLRVRRVFEKIDRERTADFVGQFRREYRRRADSVALSLDRMAGSEPLTRIAFDLGHGGDPAPYLNRAAALAQEYQLDFLEIVSSDGNIVSSAQWPARFGYKETAVASANRMPFLKEEGLPDGSSQIGLFAVRAVRGGEKTVYLVGGTRLDREFLMSLPALAGTQIFLYRSFNAGFDPHGLVGVKGNVGNAAPYQSLINQSRASGQDSEAVVYPTGNLEDSVDVTAIPLKAEDGAAMAVLIIANSRRGMVEVQQHIKAIAYGVAGGGILFAIAASLWIAARVSRPIEQLARAAGEVADGRWETRVSVGSHDEVGVLANTFNRMTSQLVEQRERLVQAERVAAWRELARRLAHELNNPLFPLQLTVENMVRARHLPQEQCDEIFEESTATLMAEIANLKTIIARFSDFSKMPKPQEANLDVREVMQRVLALFAPTLDQREHSIALETDIAPDPLMVSADAELLHRALSNLVLNAIDAMPDGGTLTAVAARKDDVVQIRISDTGTGLTPEECQRLFTPYYTTKQHGTGLGLAIVQSVVADHHGTITVESIQGSGATFVIELPALPVASEAHA